MAVSVVAMALQRNLFSVVVLFGIYMMLNGFERFWIEKMTWYTTRPP